VGTGSSGVTTGYEVVGATEVETGTVVEVVAVVEAVVVADGAELVVESAAELSAVVVVDTEFDVVGPTVDSGAMTGREPEHADAASESAEIPMISLDRIMRGLYKDRVCDRCIPRFGRKVV